MGNYYYSKDPCDWRLTASSKGHSFLEVVGSENIKGTIRYNMKQLEVTDSSLN